MAGPVQTDADNGMVIIPTAAGTYHGPGWNITITRSGTGNVNGQLAISGIQSNDTVTVYSAAGQGTGTGISAVKTAAPVSGDGTTADPVTIAPHAVKVEYLPEGAAAGKYLEGDGSWSTPTDTATVHTQSPVSGDGSTDHPVTVGNDAMPVSALKVSGKASDATYLRGDGSWSTPTDTATVHTQTPVQGDGSSGSPVKLGVGEVSKAYLDATLTNEINDAAKTATSLGLAYDAASRSLQVKRDGSGANSVTLPESGGGGGGTGAATTLFEWSRSDSAKPTLPSTLTIEGVKAHEAFSLFASADNSGAGAGSATSFNLQIADSQAEALSNDVSLSIARSGHYADSADYIAAADGNITVNVGETDLGDTWGADSSLVIGVIRAVESGGDDTKTYLDNIPSRYQGKHLAVNDDDSGYVWVTQPFVGNWEDLAAGFIFPVGTLCEYKSTGYLCHTATTKGATGPDADSAHWSLIENWQGIYDSNAYYHAGSIVDYLGGFAAALTDIKPSDPEPSAADNTKWLLVRPAGFTPSPTILEDGGKAVLASPGSAGVWTGPSLVGRGQAITSSVSYSPVDGSHDFSDLLKIDGIPAPLAQFMEAEYGNLLEWMRIPANLSMKLRQTWTDNLSGNTIAVKLTVLHGGGGSDTTLLSWSPNIPSAAAKSDPQELEHDIDLTGITFHVGDQLALVVDRVSGTASAQTVFAALASTFLDFNLEGAPTDPKDYDTYPVQARPVRDKRSIDYSDPTGIEYSFDDNTLANPTDRRYAPLAGTASPTTGGDGWTVDNNAPRGYNRHGTDIVLAKNAHLDIQYDAEFTFTDRDNDPGNPDALTVELLLQPAGTHGGTDGFANTQILGKAVASDLIAKDGDMAGTVDITHKTVSWSIPDALTDAVQATRAGLRLQDRPGEYLTAEGLLFQSAGCRRLKLGIHGEFTSDPGELQFALTTLNDSWSRGSRPFTVDKRAKDIWSGGNPTPGAPSTFDVDLYDSTSPAFRWALMLSHTNNHSWADFNVEGLKVWLDVTWWGDDDDGRTVSIPIRNRAFNLGDRICLATSNVTRSNNYRLITVAGQKLSVANSNDVAGRQPTFTGTFETGEFVGTATSDDSSMWWYLDDSGRIVARRDVRKIGITVTLSAAAEPTEIAVWREAADLGTRELLGRKTLDSSTLSFTVPSLAITSGERIIITTSDATDATVTVLADAQTLQTLPAVQTAVAGIMRPEIFARTTIPAAGAANRWRRLVLADGMTWGEQRTLHVYIQDNKGHPNQWRHLLSCPTALLLSMSPLPTDRLGTAATNTDNYVSENISGREYLLAPLADGGLALNSVETSGSQATLIYAE